MFNSRALILCLALCFLFSGCWRLRVKEGNGHIVTQNYEVSGFSEIDVNGFYKVVLEYGEKEGVRVETDENLLDYLEIYTKGDRLVISTEETVRSDHGIHVTVTYNGLKTISCSGASEISNQGSLDANELEINMSGAGLVDVTVNTEELDLDVSGAGLIKLAGNANRQYLDMSGAGKLEAFKLQSNECFVNLSGVGSAEVFVSEQLNATVSGIGEIKYRGNPSKVSQDISGLGKVKRDGNEVDDVM